MPMLNNIFQPQSPRKGFNNLMNMMYQPSTPFYQLPPPSSQASQIPPMPPPSSQASQTPPTQSQQQQGAGTVPSLPPTGGITPTKYGNNYIGLAMANPGSRIGGHAGYTDEVMENWMHNKGIDTDKQEQWANYETNYQEMKDFVDRENNLRSRVNNNLMGGYDTSHPYAKRWQDTGVNWGHDSTGVAQPIMSYVPPPQYQPRQNVFDRRFVPDPGQSYMDVMIAPGQKKQPKNTSGGGRRYKTTWTTIPMYKYDHNSQTWKEDSQVTPWTGFINAVNQTGSETVPNEGILNNYDNLLENGYNDIATQQGWTVKTHDGKVINNAQVNFMQGLHSYIANQEAKLEPEKQLFAWGGDDRGLVNLHPIRYMGHLQSGKGGPSTRQKLTNKYKRRTNKYLNEYLKLGNNSSKLFGMLDTYVAGDKVDIGDSKKKLRENVLADVVGSGMWDVTWSDTNTTIYDYPTDLSLSPIMDVTATLGDLATTPVLWDKYLGNERLPLITEANPSGLKDYWEYIYEAYARNLGADPYANTFQGIKSTIIP